VTKEQIREKARELFMHLTSDVACCHLLQIEQALLSVQAAQKEEDAKILKIATDALETYATREPCKTLDEALWKTHGDGCRCDVCYAKLTLTRIAAEIRGKK
jgi:hypothetical protein